ncbi:MAG: penicillin-binding protein 1C [Gemmatimonadota bacterium]|nr:MAG: penicillin-binding protein 1C [Gemmatimonadota bacterium]
MKPARSGRALLALAAAAIFCCLAVATWVAWPMPPDVSDPGPVPSLALLDRNGLPLRTTRAPDGSRGGWIALADIDADVLRAFLAVEDERFYDHAGIDLRAVARATRDNLRARRIVSGASTITMQTARLLRHIPRTFPGKLQQALWALRLERHLDKGKILEAYLNRLPLGQGTIGIAAAADLYFDASAAELSLGQAAMLAALAHAPSRDNPMVAPSRAAARRDRVLEHLAHLGYANQLDIQRAAQEPLITRSRGSRFLAPHFTTRVLLWAEAEDADLQGSWRTSLDLDLQIALEAEVRHTVDMLRDRQVAHSAAVVLDNTSGEILAWVGSPDFWADTAGQVDMVVSRRQPGSALKPFLYGLAFDRGYTPASVLPDIPRTYATPTGPYQPRNYDRRFHGPVRVREALASSYNVPAVELTERLGVGSLLTVLQRFGLASLDRAAEHYGLGLALGNGDVTLLELANAYRALANAGRWSPYRWRPIEGAARPALPEERRVISEFAAAGVLDILADPVARIPGFGFAPQFDFPFPVAVKTGTSRRFTDNWAVGVTSRFTIAVWAGNFSGRPMAGVSGVSGAGPLLQRAVLLAARRYAPGSLQTPAEAGLRPAVVCRLSGQAAKPGCPEIVEWFAPGTESGHLCDWHEADRVVLPPEYAEWLDLDRGQFWASASEGDLPASSDGAEFRIISPQDGDIYSQPPGVEARYATIALRAVGGTSDRVRWWVDGAEIDAPRWQLRPGQHTIRAQAGNGDWDQVTITIN